MSSILALQDLGTGSWYKGNFSAADTLYWGLKQGCAFVGNGQQQCKQWTTDGYRCEQEGELGMLQAVHYKSNNSSC